MNKKDMMQIKESLTMPAELADALQKTVTAHGRHHEGCRRFSPRALDLGGWVYLARLHCLSGKAACGLYGGGFISGRH